MARGIACALVLCLGNAFAWAADFPVAPGQSIQAAIQQAATGDRILLQPGTYFEAIDLLGKGIEVIGAGAASTILDASGLGTSAIRSEKRGFVPYTRIRALTIRGGSGSAIAGYVGGGGIHSNCANFEVLDCVIENNHVPNGRGGGIFLQSTSTVKDCVIRQNSADDGGGIYALTGMTISGCTVESNRATVDGGGLSGWGIPDHCTIRDNDAVRGGGAYLHPHLYTLGDPQPGGTLKRIVIGTPGALPVLWFGSFGLAATPLATPFGPFFLDSALLLPTTPERFGPLPASGFFAISGVVPPGTSGLTIHAQAWLGSPTPILTNLDRIRLP